MTASQVTADAANWHEFTGHDVLYREGAISALAVQRAADALLRQGAKPSVSALHEHLGGGSPNTITPLLAKYWETWACGWARGQNRSRGRQKAWLA
jgi:hypothetical protein